MRSAMLLAALCAGLVSFGCVTSPMAQQPMGKVEQCPSWAKLMFPSQTYAELLTSAKPNMVYTRGLPPGYAEGDENFFIWAKAESKTGPWTFKLGRVYCLAQKDQVRWGLLTIADPKAPPPAPETRMQFAGKYWAEEISYPGHEGGDGNHSYVRRLASDTEHGSVFEVNYVSDISGQPYTENVCAFLIYLTPDSKRWLLAAVGDLGNVIRKNEAIEEATRYDISFVWLPPPTPWPFEVKAVENVKWSEAGEQAKLAALDMTRECTMTGTYPMTLHQDADQYAVADGKQTLRQLAETLAGYFTGLADMSPATQVTAVSQWQVELLRLNPDTDPYVPLAKGTQVLLPEVNSFGGAVRSALRGGEVIQPAYSRAVFERASADP